MSVVNEDQRRLLERVIANARDAAEAAAKAALKRLAVDQDSAFDTMTDADKAQRRLLRAEVRRLGGEPTEPSDEVYKRGFPALVTEVAYQHWHRMLFARFLSENDLLMVEGMNVSVTLDDCADIANDTGEPDAWAVACRYAAAMLPGVFRTGDPVLQVRFATEGRLELERLLASLHSPIFKADDSLGWVYQFWQAKAQAEVNASGRKIGGADISPVTQLFTEHYMVQFLLHNSLGAWWAGKHPDSPLPAGDVRPTELDYLRRREDGSPAAGTFSDWPATAKELKVLDPCCGSGHFLVAAFTLMVRFRMAEEGLSERDAGDAVLRDNLFGLELDPRCTQIAAFALALAAWKHGGYRELPLPNVACSGIRLGGTADDWRKLAKRNGLLQARLEVLRQTFAQAHELGSLIRINAASEDSSPAHPTELAPDAQAVLMDVATGTRRYTDETELDAMVDAAMAQAAERFGEDDGDAPIFGAAAKQAERAMRLLRGKYHLVITNVPYLGRGKQDAALRDFCAKEYPRAKADLATVFVERCLQFCVPGGSTALVTPQNWLFLGSYASLRGYLLRQKTWDMVARLGTGAFETISGEVVNVGLFVLTNAAPKTGFVPQSNVDPFAAHAKALRRLEELYDKNGVPRRDSASGWRTGSLDEEQWQVIEAEFDTYSPQHSNGHAIVREIRDEYHETLRQSDAYRASAFAGWDVSAPRTPREKAEQLRATPVRIVGQAAQLNNPDNRIALDDLRVDEKSLSEYAEVFQGVGTTDTPRFVLRFWELPAIADDWVTYMFNPGDAPFSGYTSLLHWEQGAGVLAKVGTAHKGRKVEGRRGFGISVTRSLGFTHFLGTRFDNTIAVIVPKDERHLDAIGCYLESDDFKTNVRRVDQALSVTESSMVKVPFDLEHWQAVAAEKYPDGLPAPHSDDPTQWLFTGNPTDACAAQGQPGDALHVAVARLLGYRWPRQTGAEIPGCHLLPDDGLDAHADADGIVCLPSVNGEPPAAERLRELLAAAFGDKDQQTATETHAIIERLLAESGYGGKTLDEWLRDGFFAQHIKRFHNRPFLWHIWDGRKDGFSAIVNYHKLDRAKLEKLTYTYLGDWINRQSEGDRNNDPGANARLVEAQKLRRKLEAILGGEPPYDIYVRWKPLAAQPLGWEPDLNDGVRLNIRPFVEAGILRVKKPPINWNKDRGTNPDGTERHNDLHWTLVQKRRA